MMAEARSPERELSPPDADDLQCDWCGAGREIRIESEGGRAFGVVVKPTLTCEGCFTGKDDGPCFDDLQLAEEYEAEQEAERVHQINEQHRAKII